LLKVFDQPTIFHDDGMQRNQAMSDHQQGYRQTAETRPAFDANNAPLSIFSDRFHLIEADSSVLQERAFRVRYEVYCKEKGWEDGSHAEEYESDAYDESSRHALIFDRHEDRDVGAARIIRSQATPKSSACLPIMNHIFHDSLKTDDILALSCETSRFCVTKHSRPPALTGAAESGVSLKRQSQKKSPSYLLLSFMFQVAIEENRPMIFALIEHRLKNHFDQFGMHFLQVAPAISFKGVRIPTVLPNALESLEQIRRTDFEAWALISRDGALHDMALSRDVFVGRKSLPWTNCLRWSE
jgi:N-acyl amino acid synthase of PEP-CTERM/exosortase system